MCQRFRLTVLKIPALVTFLRNRRSSCSCDSLGFNFTDAIRLPSPPSWFNFQTGSCEFLPDFRLRLSATCDYRGKHNSNLVLIRGTRHENYSWQPAFEMSHRASGCLINHDFWQCAIVAAFGPVQSFFCRHFLETQPHPLLVRFYTDYPQQELLALTHET